MSVPPLPELGSTAFGDAPALPWPAPPEGYAAPAAAPAAPPCEIEGHNGRQMSGWLLGFEPGERALRLQMASARPPLALGFAQFRSLTLTEPLCPAPAAEGTRPGTSRCRVAMHDGSAWTGEVLGHEETPLGLFLFRTADESGALLRVFLPRESYAGFELTPAAGPAPRIATPEGLVAALAQQSRAPVLRIGEALVSLGLLTPAQLAEALARQKSRRHLPLGALLLETGQVSRENLQTALAHKMGYPLVDAARFPAETEALRQVPYPLARRLGALPLMVHEGRLVVALDDPSRRAALEELEFASQFKILPVLAPAELLGAAIRRHYQEHGEAEALPAPPIEFEPAETGRLVETLERDSAGELRDEDERQIEQSDNSLVRLIHNMIAEAHARGVSDIHIECNPGREKIRLRFRRDGLLQPYLELPHTYRNALIARIKVMAELDIAERRKPQDGKINFAKFVPGHRLELRVATVPTNGGLEDVVLRLLSSARPLALEQLGLSEENYTRLREVVERPHGMVLCVGPTGSGKSTTLHSVLGAINTPERKIWTAEDPVEITQPGLRQVQVHSKIGWTFAKALRAFLRADPDVIMVGEIRDGETARIAIEASLTGHLLLSTLHTNSATETVTRLLDMGLDPFNFADSLLAVLAQRLVRRLCVHCRQARPADEEEVEELLADWLHPCPADDPRFDAAALHREWLQRYGRDGRLVLYDSPGCEQCGGSGFNGRAGLHELMTASRELRHLIQTGARGDVLQQQALREGMRTLRQDGIEKVLQGLTSLAEVRATSNA